MAYQPQNKPGKIGHVTTVLYDKNIGIDGKLYQLLDARVDRVRQDAPALGDEVEYKISSSKELTEKGKISFFAIKRRATDIQKPVTQSTPATVISQPTDTQVIQATYVSKTGVSVKLQDCAGEEQTLRADLDVIKMLSKPDSPVQAGQKYRVQLIKDGGEWIVKAMGKPDPEFEEKPFRTGADILKENLDQKKAETEKSDAALAQINKENAEADARAAENQEYLKTLTEGQKTMTAPEPTTTPENRPQNEAVTVPDTIPKANPLTVPLKDCPVEVKIHLDCGSYSNFDLTIPGLPTDQALAKIEEDGLKFIALLHRLMAESKKGY